MNASTGASPYQAMTLAELAGLLAAAEDSEWWRYIAEFLEEYRREPPERRPALLEAEPPTTGDERWDVLLAALAEHLAAHDGRGAPPWSESRALRRFLVPVQHRRRPRRRDRQRASSLPPPRRLPRPPGAGGRMTSRASSPGVLRRCPPTLSIRLARVSHSRRGVGP